jgi:putative transposase
VIKGFKIRVYPTKEQELTFYKFIGASRFIYNWTINKQSENYKNGNNFISSFSLSKELTQLKKLEDYSWLSFVSSTMLRVSIDDCCESYIKFFDKKTKYPKFKSKKKSKPSFYVRTDRLNVKENNVNFEKIGKLKIKKNSIPQNTKLYDTRCSFDGKYWYLSFGIEVEENQLELNKNLSIGVDLGIKELAVLSNGDVYSNINKSKEMVRLYSKLKRLQRKVSNKYEMNKNGNKFIKTNNIIKLEKEIKLVHRKIANIRNTYNHKLTSDLIKLKPYRIVIEDLNISGMMKNRCLSKAIVQQCFYEIRRQIEYKSKWNGIKLVVADRWFPSSKTCCECGSIKKDLTIKDRTYICKECGNVVDRDLNASINLSNYKK